MLSNMKADGTDNFSDFFEKYFIANSEGISYKSTKINMEELALDSYQYTPEDLKSFEACLDDMLFKIKAIKKTILYKQACADKEISFLNEKLNESVKHNSIIDNLLYNVFSDNKDYKYLSYSFSNIYDVKDGESFFELSHDNSYILNDLKEYSNENTIRLSFSKRYVDNILLFPKELNYDVFDVFIESYDGFNTFLYQTNLSALKNINLQQYCYGVIIKGNGVQNLLAASPKIVCREFAESTDITYTGFYKATLDSPNNSSVYKFSIPENTIGFIVKNEFDYSSVKKEELLEVLERTTVFSEKIINDAVYENSLFDYHFIFFVSSTSPFVKKPLIFLL